MIESFVFCGLMERCLPLRGLEIGHSAYYLLYILVVIVLLTRNKTGWKMFVLVRRGM